MVVALMVLASTWSMPITFFAATKAGIEVVCLFDRCNRSMAAGDQPQGMFTVVAASSPDAKELVPVPLTGLPKFLAENPGATLRMPNSKGSTGDESSGSGEWTYEVLRQTPDEQVVGAHFFDDLAADETYRVRGNVVTPLTSKMENVGYMFVAIPFALLVAWAVRRFAKRALAKLRGAK